MDEKIARLVNWARGKEALPFTLDINPTDKCNFRCIHCWQRAFEKIDSNYELPDKTLLRIVKEALALKVKEFEITGGGEPLIRKDVVLKIAEIVKKSRRFGNITTNGSLFTLDDVKKLVKIGWDRITFSLDGPDERSNDFIRGKGSFKQVMSSIALFNEVKQKAKSYLPQLKLNVVVNKKNYNRLKQIVELAKKCGCSIVHFDSLTIHSKAGEKLKLTRKQAIEFEKYAKDAKRLAESYGIWSNVDLLTCNFLEKSNSMEEILLKESDGKEFFSLVCYEPWWHLVVKTNGFAQPCCLHDEKEANVKNFSLREIWFGDFFERIRKRIARKDLPKYCSICNAGQVFENRRIRKELLK